MAEGTSCLKKITLPPHPLRAHKVQRPFHSSHNKTVVCNQLTSISCCCCYCCLFVFAALFCHYVERPGDITTSEQKQEEAVTHGLLSIASRGDGRTTRTIILTDSTNLLQRGKSGMRSPDRNVSMVISTLPNLLWVYCPGHAGVKGNDRADRLAGKANLPSGFLLGRSEVLRSLRHYLRAQSQEHHTVDRLEERGVERGSARRSSLKGRERPSSVRRTLELFQR